MDFKKLIFILQLLLERVIKTYKNFIIWDCVCSKTCPVKSHSVGSIKSVYSIYLSSEQTIMDTSQTGWKKQQENQETKHYNAMI